MDVLLTNVAHVPDVRHHLFSLPTLIKNGHTFEGRPTDIVVRLESDRSTSFPLSGTLFSLYGYRLDISCREKARAVFARGNHSMSLGLTSTTSIALLDTISRFYSARPRYS